MQKAQRKQRIDGNENWRKIIRHRRTLENRCAQNLETIGRQFKAAITLAKDRLGQLEVDEEAFEGGDSAFRAEVRRMALIAEALGRMRTSTMEVWKTRLKAASKALNSAIFDTQLGLFDAVEQDESAFVIPERLDFDIDPDTGRVVQRTLDEQDEVKHEQQLALDLQAPQVPDAPSDDDEGKPVARGRAPKKRGSSKSAKAKPKAPNRGQTGRIRHEEPEAVKEPEAPSSGANDVQRALPVGAKARIVSTGEVGRVVRVEPIDGSDMCAVYVNVDGAETSHPHHMVKRIGGRT